LDNPPGCVTFNPNIYWNAEAPHQVERREHRHLIAIPLAQRPAEAEQPVRLEAKFASGTSFGGDGWMNEKF